MTEKPDLVALLGSRICHDLISPLGAIGNGVELLTMSGSTVGPEIALIAESVAQANARIRYFRVAFGMASSEQRIGRPEILSILTESSRGGRVEIDWAVPGDLARCEVKLAFLLLQCLASAMPFGGRVAVTCVAGQWGMRASAARLRIDDALWEMLSNPAAEATISAAQVQFALAPEELRRQKRKFTAEMREDAIRLSW